MKRIALAASIVSTVVLMSGCAMNTAYKQP